jgi:putative transposase
MVHYRRNFVPGGTYFFTVTLRDRSSQVLVENINLLRKSFRVIKQKHPFDIVASVVLPDHIHAIWTLPENDNEYPMRWQSIKARFTRELRKNGTNLNADSNREYGLWQRRYWEHTIRNSEDLRRHIDYIHYNPVKHGLVQQLKDWPYSSFHRYVQKGVLPMDWGSNIEILADGDFGE